MAAEALPSLIACLKDPDFTIRDDAVMGLGTIGGFKLYVEDRADLGYDALYENLQGVIGKSRVEILCHNPLPDGLPPDWPAADAVHFSPGRCQFVAETEHPARAVVELVKWVDGCGAGLSDIHIKRPTLEDVFIELTGKTLRD